MSGQSYEVSTFVRNHWEIQSRFRGGQKDQALENARSMERARPDVPVKVVQESYDPHTGRSVEIVIYRTPESVVQAARRRKMENLKARHAGRSGGSDYLDILPDPFDTPAKPKSSMSMMGFVLLILMASTGMAAVSTLVFSLAAPKLAAMIGVKAILGKQALMGVFVLAFALTSLLMFGLYRSRLVLAGDSPGKKAKEAFKEAQAKKEEERRKAAGEIISAAQEKLDKDKAEAEAKKKGDEWSVDIGEDEEAQLSEKELEDQIVDQVLQEHEDSHADLDAEQEAADDSNDEEAELAARIEAHKLSMMNFISGGLKSIANRGSLDNFSRFGINLFIAGAVEMIATRDSLTQSETQHILQSSVEILGTKKIQAEKFAKSFESYLMNARYLEMVNSGREAMSTFMDGNHHGAEDLAQALEEWINPPEADQAAMGPIAVMFTDIVGSTDMTVSLGDHAAQHMVRTHNRIVRTALTNFYGREVKHTGDGIMASFVDVSNAVRAAIEIQKRTLGNNLASPDQSFSLRIGIEAGEPIAEENDLFGVTVQMAARLCAAADVDQILIAQDVTKAVEGTDIVTTPLPPQKMKGFTEPVPLWSVSWNNNAPVSQETATATPAMASEVAGVATKLPGLSAETMEEETQNQPE